MLPQSGFYTEPRGGGSIEKETLTAWRKNKVGLNFRVKILLPRKIKQSNHIFRLVTGLIIFSHRF